MVKILDASASSGPEMDDPDAASLEAAMQVPITVILGPMGPLLWKLHWLMAPERRLAPALLSADDIRLLSDDFKDLCVSLSNMSQREVDASFMARWWMKIVRELCYDTEDHLDEVYGGARAHHHFSWLFAREKDDFSGLLARAKDASESLKCVNWPSKTAEPDSGETGVRRLTSLELVHVEPPNKLVELLDLDDDDDKKILKVITITGCAGVGKTTVARALYHRHAWKFQCQAFVTVSRNPDMRGFLTSMLSQLKAPPPHGFPDVPDLIEAISKHLQGKRYFVVIDDLWTASVWSIISRGFPRGDHCSRIITITHIDDVALACCSYDSDYIYKMEPLNDHESRKLFFGRVFGSEDGCPTDIKEVSYEIIRKCGGLPLVIVSIASLLATESSIGPEKWKHIQDFLSFSYFVEEEGRPTNSRERKRNGKSPAVLAAKDNLGLLGHGMSSSSTEMIDVLNLLYHRLAHLMYKSLPPRLRTCLLYLSMYAQGYVIKKDELVKQWVAEGFLSSVVGRDTEDIAGGYFDELVSRGIIQAMETDYNGEVLSCTVHQMVLDFIRHKCMEENFIITVDYSQSTLALPDKVRRLSVQFGGVESAYIPETIVTSQVRSVIFWGFLECVPSITDYKLLRVLVLHIWADQGKTSFDLTRIGELFRLKYIKIECNITVKLPSKIQGLQQLETLQVDARLSIVPSDIVNLERLLHLSLPSEYILPGVIAHMTSLRTLRYFDIGSQSENNVLHLGRLTNLHDLQLTCSRVRPAEKLEKNVQLLGLILEKLSVLRSVTLVPAASGSFCVNIPEDGFRMESPPLDLLLRRMELSRRCCIFFSLPKWFGELRRLCILKIAIRELSMNNTDVLKGLPALAALTLYIQTVSEEKIVIHEGGFQALMYFKFMCDAPRLSFVQGAMPGVQKLKIRFNSNKWRAHTFGTAGFCHLTCLTEVFVKFGALGAREFNIKAAESALKAAVRDHPNSPTIRVQLADVISYGKEKLQEIRDGKRKKMERSDEKRHGGKKRKMERLEEYVNKPSVDSRYAGRCCIFTPLAHHPQSVDLVTGAMGSLLPKLLDLLEDEYNLEAKVKDGIKSLYKELESMQDDLWIVAKLEPPQLDPVTSMWAKEVRDFSYDAEDVIDSVPVLVGGSWAGIGGLISWIAECLSTRKARHMFANTINGMTRQAQNLKALGCQMPLVAINTSNPIAANPNDATSGDPHIISMYEHLTGLVGINAFMDEVIKELTHGTDDEPKQLKIVSIVGMGGLGKTTLAKAVYDKIRVQYDFTAFISVSRHPDMRKVYMDILFQIGKQSYTNPDLAEYGKRQLIGEVTALLANRRYLIVFDDIWDVNSWEVIKFALIDSGLGSRVLTTTRIFEVAVNADDVYMLQALSDSHSEELFNTRLFGGKDNVPCVVPKVPEKLLQKCGGVPLAIITMAGLLVGTPRNEWSRAYNSIGFGSEVGVNTHVDNARKILLSSYYDLPYHLRACLLYLHIFPEGRLIEKETLIWKWAAEGLIVEEPGTVLFELGEGYFEELINRNLVMLVEDDSYYGKKVCVHDMVLDMICCLSVEENFVTVLDGNEQYFPVERERKARRLAVQKRAPCLDAMLYARPERLRSFNATGCHFSMELSLSRFKLLRVIAIEECKCNTFGLEHLGMLHLLRYLGLYNTRIDELPEEIGDLIYLQTMDLRGTGVKKLPRGVARLRQLKCLRADGCTTVPDWMGNLTSLEELRIKVGMSGNFAIELRKLTELRELEIWIEKLDVNQNKALLQSLRTLEKIQVLRLMGYGWSSGGELNWGDFHYCKFPRLRRFSTSVPVRFLPGAMPTLEFLHFDVNVPALEDANFNFDHDFVASTLGNLPSLQEVEVVIISTADLFEAMYEALKRAMDEHPNSPSLRVINIDVKSRA